MGWPKKQIPISYQYQFHDGSFAEWCCSSYLVSFSSFGRQVLEPDIFTWLQPTRLLQSGVSGLLGGVALLVCRPLLVHRWDAERIGGMMLSFAFFDDPAEVLLVFALILLLFSGKKLPELGRGLMMGVNEFLTAAREVADDMATLFQSDRLLSREDLLSWSTVALVFAVGALALIAFQISK